MTGVAIPYTEDICAAYIDGVSFRKMDKGGQNNTLRRFGGAKGLCVAAHPVGGCGGHAPPENF